MTKNDQNASSPITSYLGKLKPRLKDQNVPHGLNHRPDRGLVQPLLRFFADSEKMIPVNTFTRTIPFIPVSTN